MHVEDLETVSSIVDLSHQVVTQIVAGKKVSVQDALAAWHEDMTASRFLTERTIHTNHQFLTHWAREMDLLDKPLTCVKPKHVSDYVNRGGEQRTTAVRKLTAIRQFFGYCQDNGLMYRNPAGPTVCKVTYDVFKHEEKESKEKKVFSESEISTLLGSTDDPFWIAAILIGVRTGLRLGDIAKLEWSSLKDDTLTVWTDKTNKRVVLPVDATLSEAFSRIRETDITYLFPTQREIASSPSRRALLSVQFSRLCDKAGIAGKSFHSLRHTNATGLVQAGQSLEVIADRLGHSSTKTTQGYVHVS